jgi:hypothetical protein
LPVDIKPSFSNVEKWIVGYNNPTYQQSLFGVTLKKNDSTDLFEAAIFLASTSGQA